MNNVAKQLKIPEIGCTVSIYREYFNESAKFACIGKVVNITSKTISVEMPIGDVYDFSRELRTVLNNNQQLTICYDYLLSPFPESNDESQK